MQVKNEEKGLLDTVAGLNAAHFMPSPETSGGKIDQIINQTARQKKGLKNHTTDKFSLQN